jgi:hypothetical protein
MEQLSYVHPGVVAVFGVAAAVCVQWVLWGRIARQRVNADRMLSDLAARNPELHASMSHEDRESLRKLMRMLDELRRSPGRFEEVWDRWAYQIPGLAHMSEERKQQFKQRYETMRRRPLLSLHYRVLMLLAPIVIVVAGLWPHFITGVQCTWLAVGLLLGTLLWFCRHPSVL